MGAQCWSYLVTSTADTAPPITPHQSSTAVERVALVGWECKRGVGVGVGEVLVFGGGGGAACVGVGWYAWGLAMGNGKRQASSPS